MTTRRRFQMLQKMEHSFYEKKPELIREQLSIDEEKARLLKVPKVLAYEYNEKTGRHEGKLVNTAEYLSRKGL